MVIAYRWTRPLDPATDDVLLWLWRCRLLHHLTNRLHGVTPRAGKE